MKRWRRSKIERRQYRRPWASKSPTTRRWAALAAATSVVLLGWGVVLPRLGAWQVVADHIATQQRLEIDPSALFYTELKPSAAFAHRGERRLEDSPADFWRLTTRRPGDAATADAKAQEDAISEE